MFYTFSSNHDFVKSRFWQIPILANPDFVKSRFCHFVILPFWSKLTSLTRDLHIGGFTILWQDGDRALPNHRPLIRIHAMGTCPDLTWIRVRCIHPMDKDPHAEWVSHFTIYGWEGTSCHLPCAISVAKMHPTGISVLWSLKTQYPKSSFLAILAVFRIYAQGV